MKFAPYLLLFFLTLISCGGNDLRVDISDVDLNLKVMRLEQDLTSPHPDSLIQHSSQLHEKYGTFYKRLVEDILKLGLVEDPALGYNLKDFVTDKDVKTIFSDVNNKYADFSDLENELEKGFRHYKYYFPDKLIPDIVTFVSGFNFAVVALDSTLGIGLDMYLGTDYEFYSHLGFPNYQTRTMRREYIASDAMKGWLETEFKSQNPKTLLDHMVEQGKVLYLMDAIFPDMNDSLKIGYSKKELEWCDNNEFKMWAHLIDNELLFSTDFMEIRRLMGEGPFTKDFTKESPARTGAWIGWQIIREFMNEKKVTIPELVKLKNSQSILKESTYKPE